MIGPVLDAGDAVEAVADTLTLWLPSVLAERTAAGKMELPAPARVELVPQRDALRPDRPAAFAVTCMSVAEHHRQAPGLWDITFGVLVAIYARGQSYADTSRRLWCYCGAAVQAVAQHRHLGRGADFLATPVSQEYGTVPDEEARSLGSAVVGFDVRLSNVIDESLAPAAPPTDPADLEPDAPQITKVEVLEGTVA